MKEYNGNVYLKILVNLIIYAVVILSLMFVFPEILKFFLPFIIAWIIATIANPLVKFLEKRVKIVRKLSSFIVIILVIGIVILAIYGIVRFLRYQISGLIDDLPNIVALISDAMDQVGQKLSGVIRVLPEGIQESTNQFVDNIKLNINSFIVSERVSDATISFTRSIVDYVLMIIIVFISAYFLIKDREIIAEKTRNLTPEPILEKYDLVKYHFKYALGGYFKAQFKIMFIIIIIMFIGFRLIGTKYSLLIAIITGLIDVLPVFGTGFILWPWALVEFILGNYFNALFLMGIYLVCQLVKNILQPKIVGDSIGMDPLVTLLLMYTGYRLGGFIGMIFAIPLGLIIANLYNVGMFNNIIRGLKILINDINKYRKF